MELWDLVDLGYPFSTSLLFFFMLSPDNYLPGVLAPRSETMIFIIGTKLQILK